MKKLKILVSCLYFQGRTGSEIYFMELCTSLAKIGHEVFLFSPNTSDEFVEIAKSKKFLVIEKIELQQFDLLIISHWKALRPFISDKIHKFNKIINIVHSEIYEVEMPALDLKVDQYICVRESIKMMLLNEYKIPESKIKVIYNPIDTSKFNRINCSDNKYGIFIGTYSKLRHQAMMEFAEYCKANSLKSIFVGFAHDKVNFFDETFPNLSDVSTLIKNATICGGIIHGRTYWEAELCGKQTLEFLIDKDGNVLERILDKKINDWDELYFKLNTLEVTQQILQTVDINLNLDSIMINKLPISQLEFEANLVINHIKKINKIDHLAYERKKLLQIDLICIDTLQPEEAFKSLLICNHFFEFGKMIMVSNSVIPNSNRHNIKHYHIEHITKKEYSDYCFHMSDYSDNDFVLIVQHDGFICNPKLWDDDFLKFDYLGAPFNNFAMSICSDQFMESPCYNSVGNGGFSLRSKKLLNFMKFISNLPRIREEEDIVLCIQYYNLAKSMGIKFADKNLSHKFSYESDMKADRWITTEYFDPIKQFGFHHISNKNKLLKDLKIRNEVKHFTNYLKKSKIEDFFDIKNELFIKNLEKLDLSDLTIFIPISLDCDERFDNLKKVIDNVLCFFDVKIYILNHKNQNYNLYQNYFKNLPNNVNVINFDYEIFEKSKICNHFLNEVIDTKYGLYLEADFLFDPVGLIDCYSLLKQDKFKFAFPFNGLPLYLSKEKSLNFDPKQTRLPIWKILHKIDNYEEFLEKPIDISYLHIGFCFMFELQTYRECGFENPNLNYWACDDNERIVRICKLGFDYYHSNKFGFHLWHPRDSKFYSNYNLMLEELERINLLENDELVSEIKSWHKTIDNLNTPLN